LGTGQPQYYAIKQSYIFLQLGGTFLLLILTDHDFLPIQKRFFGYTAFIALLILPIAKPSFYSGGFMGTLPKIISIAMDGRQWTAQIMDANFFTHIAELPKSDQNACMIVRYKNFPADLSSRWVNALSAENRINSECFAGFWNNDVLTPSELFLKLKALDGEFIVLTNDASIMQLDLDVKDNIKVVRILELG